MIQDDILFTNEFIYFRIFLKFIENGGWNIVFF